MERTSLTRTARKDTHRSTSRGTSARPPAGPPRVDRNAFAEQQPMRRRTPMLMGGPDRSGEHALFRMHGDRVGHGWMTPDPEARYPTATEVFWLLALVFGVIVCVGVLQPSA